MKNFAKIISIGIFYLIISSFTGSPESPVKGPDSPAELKWITWEEAEALNKENPKKIFVDVYTDWCHWCKQMDKTTFLDPEVMKILGNNFYAVKLNAEQTEDIVFQNNTFKYIPAGRHGYHQLAQALLNGRMSYPSFVILDESYARIMISPGYQKPKEIIQQLIFARDEAYKKMSWETYRSKT